MSKEFFKQAATLQAAAMSTEEAPNGRISGNVCSFGIVQQNWTPTVCCPNCFDGALDWWRTNGFVAEGHDWDEMGVAMPRMIEQRGKFLYSEADFHSTPDAQTVRTKCQERLAAGLGVGLSVGFWIAEDGSHYFENGEDLLAWATGKGYDMSMFDTEDITAQEDGVRAISMVETLAEWSIVTIPANRLSYAADCNAAATPSVDELLSAVERSAKSKPISPGEKARLEAILSSLREEAPPEKSEAEPRDNRAHGLVKRTLALRTAGLRQN